MSIFGTGFNEDLTHLLCELLSECLDIKIDRIIKFTKVRNINFYFSFCSQKTLASEAYDTVSEFIHISLNYGVNLNEPLVMCYTFYDKDHEKELDNRFKYYEINVEKFAKLWYDKDMKSAREKPLLTMIGIKNKEDLEKYCSEINNSSVKESVDKLKRLNKDDVFIYDITPEEEKYIQNTERNIARREGLAEGKAKGELNVKLNIAKKLLNNDYSVNEIVEITGLSQQEIES